MLRPPTPDEIGPRFVQRGAFSEMNPTWKAAFEAYEAWLHAEIGKPAPTPAELIVWAGLHEVPIFSRFYYVRPLLWGPMTQEEFESGAVVR